MNTPQDSREMKLGIHKEGMETFYYTKTSKFVLRMAEDQNGEAVPVWVWVEKSAPPKEEKAKGV